LFLQAPSALPQREREALYLPMPIGPREHLRPLGVAPDEMFLLQDSVLFLQAPIPTVVQAPANSAEERFAVLLVPVLVGALARAQQPVPASPPCWKPSVRAAELPGRYEVLLKNLKDSPGHIQTAPPGRSKARTIE
jgi:hypothetical protein